MNAGLAEKVSCCQQLIKEEGGLFPQEGSAQAAIRRKIKDSAFLAQINRRCSQSRRFCKLTNGETENGCNWSLLMARLDSHEYYPHHHYCPFQHNHHRHQTLWQSDIIPDQREHLRAVPNLQSAKWCLWLQVGAQNAKNRRIYSFSRFSFHMPAVTMKNHCNHIKPKLLYTYWMKHVIKKNTGYQGC